MADMESLRPPSLAGQKVVLAVPRRADIESVAAFCAQFGPQVHAIAATGRLLMAHGAGIIRTMKDAGATRVYADAKLHDTPDEAEDAAKLIWDAGADMLSVHGAGTGIMVQRAVSTAPTGCRVVVVTLLTSITSNMAKAVYGRELPFDEIVGSLARIAGMEHVWGVTCSPKEADMLRRNFTSLKRVIYAARFRDAIHDSVYDQRRLGTLREGVLAQGDLFGIGRDVTGAVSLDADKEVRAAGWQQAFDEVCTAMHAAEAERTAQVERKSTAPQLAVAVGE